MADAAAETPARRDWVEEAYRAFIANADGLDQADPVKAVGAYFERTASDELKARAKAEGRTPAKCWTFVEAVARKALKGRSGHIDPSAVYAIAMHWYEDVPVYWDAKPKAEPAKPKAAAPEKPAAAAGTDRPEAQEPVRMLRNGRPAKPAGGQAKKRKPKDRQTFFFDILGPAGGNGASVG